MITIQGDYEYFSHPENGETLAANRRTGEVIETMTVICPVGSRVTTPEQRKRNKEKAARGTLRRLSNRDLPFGHFCFVSLEERFENMSPENLARLVYLSTYIKYNSNKLMLTNKTVMKQNDLQTLFKVSRTTVHRFLKEAAKYLDINNGELSFKNANIFAKGEMRGKLGASLFQKIYIDGVRSLYETATKADNKKEVLRRFGYILKLLPFVNVEHNILCHNPLETDPDKIELLTLSEFCEYVGYSSENASRLADVYNEIYFEMNGERKRLCVITYEGHNNLDAKVCINPRIFYSGSFPERVKIFEVLSRCKNKSR